MRRPLRRVWVPLPIAVLRLLQPKLQTTAAEHAVLFKAAAPCVCETKTQSSTALKDIAEVLRAGNIAVLPADETRAVGAATALGEDVAVAVETLVGSYILRLCTTWSSSQTR